MADFHSLDRLAGRQQGLANLTQLRSLSFSETEIELYISRRVLTRYPNRPGVYRLCAAPSTRDQALMAAVLAARHDPVVGAVSAACHFGFRDFPDPPAIELLVESDCRVRLPGVVGRRTISLPPSHRTVHRSVPVTTIERTLVDVCGRVPYKTFERAADELRRTRQMSIVRLQRVVTEVPVSGRRAMKPVLRYLRTYEGHPGDNDAELDLLRLLRKAGVDPLPEPQLRVAAGGRTRKVDYAFRHIKHGFERMGFNPHGLLVSVFHDDADRVRALQRAGWTLWPVTARTPAEEVVALARDLAAQEAAARDAAGSAAD